MPADGVPTRRELVGAYWVGRVLRPTGLTAEQLHASYRILPLGGRLDLTDLETSERLLEGAGLASRDGAILTPSLQLQRICGSAEQPALEMLLAAVLERNMPLWLSAADAGDHIRTDLIPEAAELQLGEVLGDIAQREAFLMARARKVEANVRAEIGRLGEIAVVRALRDELLGLDRPDLADQVQQVSAISDELGYDVVAPRLDGAIRRLEVKTVGQSPSFVTIYLSRTEAMVGLADPNWSLVICELANPGQAEVLGWIPGAPLRRLLPTNQHLDGSWETARLRLPLDGLASGSPPASPA